MKKILVFVLTLLVAATALIGCAPRDPETPETPDEVNLDIDKNITAEVSILIPSGNANEKTMIEALAESFNEIYPNVTFKYSYVAVNSYENTVRNLFRTGSLDDIVWTNSPDVYYLADKNIATNLTPYIEASEEAGVFRLEEDFYQEFFDVAAVDGKQYAIPRSADSVVTFVNKDILKRQASIWTPKRRSSKTAGPGRILCPSAHRSEPIWTTTVCPITTYATQT